MKLPTQFNRNSRGRGAGCEIQPLSSLQTHSFSYDLVFRQNIPPFKQASHSALGTEQTRFDAGAGSTRSVVALRW